MPKSIRALFESIPESYRMKWKDYLYLTEEGEQGLLAPENTEMPSPSAASTPTPATATPNRGLPTVPTTPPPKTSAGYQAPRGYQDYDTPMITSKFSSGWTPEQTAAHDKAIGGMGYTMADIGSPGYKDWHNSYQNYQNNLPPGVSMTTRVAPHIADPATAKDLSGHLASASPNSEPGTLPVSWWTDQHQTGLENGYFTPGSPNYRNVAALRGQANWQHWANPTWNKAPGEAQGGTPRAGNPAIAGSRVRNR